MILIQIILQFTKSKSRKSRKLLKKSIFSSITRDLRIIDRMSLTMIYPFQLLSFTDNIMKLFKLQTLLNICFSKIYSQKPKIDFVRFGLPPESFFELFCLLQTTLPLVCQHHCSYHLQISILKHTRKISLEIEYLNQYIPPTVKHTSKKSISLPKVFKLNLVLK